MITLIWYPKCSTCKRAKTWLDEHKIEYIERDIVKENPKKEELKEWFTNNDYPLKRFFNTSGNLYKEMNLKETLETMNEEEQLSLLSTNGMLVKRPILLIENKVLLGFKEELWNKILKGE